MRCLLFSLALAGRPPGLRTQRLQRQFLSSWSTGLPRSRRSPQHGQHFAARCSHAEAPGRQQVFHATARGPDDEPDAAYVHIPFCRRRCFYCDFPIAVIGAGRSQRAQSMREQYLDALCREIETTERKSGAPARRLRTVFFGGGTPSLLTAGELERVLRALEGRFGVEGGAEVSVEMDPGTFDEAKLRDFVSLGVSRVSLGIQSFDPDLLRACGRAHTAEEGDAALAAMERTGVRNFSVDLISGLPGQTAEAWRASLRAAVASGCTHVSTYDLTLEGGTNFARRREAGRLHLPPEEAAADMYREASRVLREEGFEHYEVSNYARPGFQSLHNRVYWENRPYWGFGLGAASYARGVRYTRPAAMDEYLLWAAAGAGGGVRAGGGGGGGGGAGAYEGRGWTRVEGGRVRLTDPEGFLFENVVLVDLFTALDALDPRPPPRPAPAPAPP
eukprot:tig00020930_g16026.t1